MKRSARLGMASAVALSLGLAASAPQPTPEHVMPGQETAVGNGPTAATQRVANFAAFVLGALQAEGGEERDKHETYTQEINRGYISLRFNRVAPLAGCADSRDVCGTVYTIFATAKQDAETRRPNPAAITSVTVQESRFTSTTGSLIFALNARPTESGWAVDVGRDTDGVAGGDLHTFSANTGSSIAEPQTRELIDSAADIVIRATA